jgi:hypothetical protein
VPSASCPISARAASPARVGAGRRVCSRPPSASPRTRPPARPPGHWRCTWARHGRIAFGQEIEIHQGVEIGRPSTLYARVEGTGDQVDTVEVASSAVVVANGELRV